MIRKKLRDPENLFFFLGGRDLEMLEIRQLLEEFAPGRFSDKALRWGASASSYRHEIEDILKKGKTPVLIELENDCGLNPERVLKVDHHDLSRGHVLPSALRQVFDLLGLPEKEWTRRRRLVAANDRSHVQGMLREGASRRELCRIRAEDRAAQGITPAEEEQAKAAVEGAERLAGGRLTLVLCPHSRAAAVTDLLDASLGGPGFENLLIVSPNELNFFGSGRLVGLLASALPDGWYGGELPRRGFWGIRVEDSERRLAEILEVLTSGLAIAGHEKEEA